MCLRQHSRRVSFSLTEQFAELRGGTDACTVDILQLTDHNSMLSMLTQLRMLSTLRMFWMLGNREQVVAYNICEISQIW